MCAGMHGDRLDMHRGGCCTRGNSGHGHGDSLGRGWGVQGGNAMGMGQEDATTLSCCSLRWLWVTVVALGEGLSPSACSRSWLTPCLMEGGTKPGSP